MRKIEDDPSRDGWIRDAATFLLSRFNERLPLNRQMMASAILYNEIQHLPAVDEWLDEHVETRLGVLTQIARDFEINIDSETEVGATTQRNVQQKSRTFDIRSMLIQKYSLSSSNRVLRMCSAFGEQMNARFHLWTSLPKLLSKPSTLSVADALLRDHRATTYPLRVQKTLFIHDNYAFLKSDI